MKPSRIIQSEVARLIAKEGLTKPDARHKAILMYLNTEYLKRPTNEEPDASVDLTEVIL